MRPEIEHWFTDRGVIHNLATKDPNYNTPANNDHKLYSL